MFGLLAGRSPRYFVGHPAKSKFGSGGVLCTVPADRVRLHLK